MKCRPLNVRKFGTPFKYHSQKPFTLIEAALDRAKNFDARWNAHTPQDRIPLRTRCQADFVDGKSTPTNTKATSWTKSRQSLADRTANSTVTLLVDDFIDYGLKIIEFRIWRAETST
jgi:DNA-dependent RNA polymerase auxiliary subunit epsilon